MMFLSFTNNRKAFHSRNEFDKTNHSPSKFGSKLKKASVPKLWKVEIV